MSVDIRRQASTAGRYLIVRELRSMLTVWIALVVCAALFAAAVAITIGGFTSSIWEQATQLPRWFAAVWGVHQIAGHLPLFIAHGHTRREFATQIIRVAAVCAVALAALVTVGFALEWAAYRVLGWPQSLKETYLLFSSPREFPLILVQYAITFFAWIVIGAALGAASYRYRHWALLLVPVVLAVLVLVESTLGTVDTRGVGLTLALDVPAALAVYALIVAGGLWATWILIRDLPMRTKHN